MSDIVKLEALNGQYKNKLTEYESAYATYIQGLQQNDNTYNSYIVLPGKTYQGTASISDISGSTLTRCEASCSQQPLCSGASFNSITNVCKLRSGEAGLTAGATSDHAIITKSRANILHLNTLNDQLIEINRQMNEIHKTMQPQTTKQSQVMAVQGDELQQRGGLLTTEKDKIKRLLTEYNDVVKNNADQTITVEQKSSVYVIWLILCIMAILLAVKYTVFPDVSMGLFSTFLGLVLFTVLYFFLR